MHNNQVQSYNGDPPIGVQVSREKQMTDFATVDVRTLLIAPRLGAPLVIAIANPFMHTFACTQPTALPL